MAKKPDTSTNPTGLRTQAEERLRLTRRDVTAMPIKDVQQLVYELQVHQIELEMQNNELRRTQTELEAARDRYVDLHDFSPAGHLTLDTHGTIIEANLRAGTLLGINRNKLIGQSLAGFVASDDQDVFHRHCQDVMKTGTRHTCEVHLRGKAGVCSCVYIESLAVHQEPGCITHWRAALLDISDRKRAEQELVQHVHMLGNKQKELEFLAEKLLIAQEEERKRIARDLHDDVNQRLAALAVELESIERGPLASPELVARQLAAIRVQVGQLSDDLHDLAYRLHPSLLEHVGLEVAARDHVAEFAKRTGLSVTFTAREVPETLSSEVATNLFRVMQESLQNVSKHAEATDVTVRLSGSSKGVGVSVRDNGKGFSGESKNGRTQGLGLVSMHERARGLGGFLRIHSLPRAGTKVCAWIPHVQEGA